MRKLTEGQFAIGGLFAFSLWIFVALPFFYSVPRYSYAEDHHTQQTTDTSGTQHKPKEPFWDRATDDPVAVFTLALVVFTFVLAVSTIGLWIVTWLSGRRQSRDMEDSIATANRSANIAEMALTQTQRALIVPTKIDVYHLMRRTPAGGKIAGYRTTFILVNTGTTVAKNVLSLCNKMLFDGDMPASFDFADTGVPDPAPKVAGPHAPMIFPIDFSLEELQEIESGKKNGYIWGWVEYNDIFDGTPRRRTEYCARVKITADLLNPGEQAVPIGLAYTTAYNGIDENCFRKPAPFPPARTH